MKPRRFIFGVLVAATAAGVVPSHAVEEGRSAIRFGSPLGSAAERVDGMQVFGVP